MPHGRASTCYGQSLATGPQMNGDCLEPEPLIAYLDGYSYGKDHGMDAALSSVGGRVMQKCMYSLKSEHEEG